MMKSNPTAVARVQNLVAILNAPDTRNYDWGLDVGRKYIRLWHADKVTLQGRSVYCFIDADGVVWYPAGWAGPTKNHPRGDISTPEGLTALADLAGRYPFGGSLTIR